MKQSVSSEHITEVFGRMCQLQNQPAGDEPDFDLETECRTEIDQWREQLPRPKLGLQIAVRNCTRAKAEG